MGAQYTEPLDHLRTTHLIVDFTTRRDEVVDYALVLVVEEAGRRATVRIYDGAHGQNELHRYTRELGKQPAEIFHLGTLGEGMRAALTAIKSSYEEMIEGWRRG